MKLKIFKSLWGMTGNYEEMFSQIAEAGFAGVESPAPAENQATLFKQLLNEYELEYIAQTFSSVEDHIGTFEQQVKYALQFEPVKVGSHSAKDWMPFDEQCNFYEKALALEESLGITVAHETHRGRAMFTPWTTAALLKKFPELRIAADYSHWCCVCESLLEDQEHNLELAHGRTIHTHGRVGYAEGPQVTDPSAPEVEYVLQRHLGWWLEIAKAHQKAGQDVMTFTPEFGPPDYQHVLPFTKQPIADLWDINYWIAKKFKEEFGKHISSLA